MGFRISNMSNIQLLLTFRVKHLAFVSALFDYLVVRSYLHRQWPGSEHGSGEYCAALSCGHGRRLGYPKLTVFRFSTMKHDYFLGWSWSTPKGNPREPVLEVAWSVRSHFDQFLLVVFFGRRFHCALPCRGPEHERNQHVELRTETICILTRYGSPLLVFLRKDWISQNQKPGGPGLFGRGSLNSNLKVFFCCDWNSIWTYEHTE